MEVSTVTEPPVPPPVPDPPIDSEILDEPPFAEVLFVEPPLPPPPPTDCAKIACEFVPEVVILATAFTVTLPPVPAPPPLPPRPKVTALSPPVELV